LDGKNAKAWRLRGDLLREAGGDLNRAAADLSKAIELDPQDAEAYELRGVVYTNQRRLDRALADYDQAIKLKPDDAQAWSDRGVNYYLGGDNEKAIRDLSEALRLDPNRPPCPKINCTLTAEARAVLNLRCFEPAVSGKSQES